MIDYSFFSTLNTACIEKVLDAVSKSFRPAPPEKGWRGVRIYTDDKGVKVYARENRYSECSQIYIAFSPHKVHNNNKHNANIFSLQEAQDSIIKTFKTLNIDRQYFKEFYISTIEIGVNFYVNRDTETILNSALLYRQIFFNTHEKYRHYRTAKPEKSKYAKIKFYIKSKQFDEALGATYHDLGYCPDNVMRFECKLERAGKFKFLDFGNLDSLFLPETEEILKNHLLQEFDKVFFYYPDDVQKRKLRTATQIKTYHQQQVKNFWQNLNTRQRTTERKKYEKLPKKTDVKTEIKDAILQSLNSKKHVSIPLCLPCKNMSQFPSDFVVAYPAKKPINSNGSDRFCIPSPYIGIGNRTFFYQKETPKKRYCLVTGIDISMQKKGSKFLCFAGLKYYKENDPETYEKLTEKYLTAKQKEKDLERQIYFMAHNIRNAKTNPKHNPKYSRQRFEARNYHPDQLRLFA